MAEWGWVIAQEGEKREWRESVVLENGVYGVLVLQIMIANECAIVSRSFMADPEIDNLNSDQNIGDNIFVTTMDHPESVASNVYETPNGTRYWTPIVPRGVKPVLKARFTTIKQAVAMYEEYAQLAGFGTRLGTSKKVKIGNEVITTRRYVLCSRAPVNKHKHKETNPDDIDSTSPSRRSNVKVTDCKACMKFRRIKKSTDYEIYGFVEEHNHGFTSPENLDLSLKRRKLDFSTQEFIAKCRNANLGPTKSHKVHVAIKGGHHNVHGTVVDYKNCGRDIRDFIGDRDAQMIIDKFKARSENKVNYTFDTHIDDMELQLIFWCDGVSKIVYEAFGDVLAFDATYDMIFVPFTGVDHHKKCTIFGAGLLHNETIESYTWLLQKFLQAHNGKQPLLILTDQDCAMKQAVANVFDKSIHRLCMWHIIQKLPAKIKGNDKRNAEIKKKFHKLVWNVYIKPETFEKRWHLLITEYGLEEHSWLTEIDRMRGKIDKLEELDAQVQALKDKIFAEVPYDPEVNKKVVVYQEILSHAIPEELSCTAPKKIRNKGCGKHKRPVGSKEIAIKKFKKKRRKCSVCGKRVRKHDKRNCPTKKGKPTKDDSSTKEVDEEEDDDHYEYDEGNETGTDGEGNETGTDSEGNETGTDGEDKIVTARNFLELTNIFRTIC
ncbi:protein FAR1-RELATED SEQUENCE 5-like [Helianthus annuus]|uniref:protein FAR1-RELATED SEQUENCE 5-like n=1 Tax=Helianthus annuus TaxID=4232 RepID=UPI000B90296B|nr:protein FAR1-RELATED SEQUENCE 5-like [Helianthus annuus]